MEPLQIIQIIIGLVLSIAIDIIVGLFLGYNEAMKNITGGITAFNLWLYIGAITIILLIIWALKRGDEYKKSKKWIAKLFERK